MKSDAATAPRRQSRTFGKMIGMEERTQPALADPLQ
jgi:hypothetical protein